MSNGFFKLKIVKPCTEDWDAMTPDGAGRFCHSCNKQVIDFSVLNDYEIQNYFLNNYNKQVCGRFRNVQLERIRIKLPNYFFEKKIPAWQKYLVVFLICFGSNLYSLDISVGNTSNLYAQTHTIASANSDNEKLPRKNKKPKRKKKNITPRWTECTMISGMVGPEFKPYNSGPEVISLKSLQSDTILIPDTSGITIKELNSSTPHEPVPEKKEQQRAEFILPVAFRLRKRKNT